MSNALAEPPLGITPAGSPSERIYFLLKRLACESPHPITYGQLAAIVDTPRWRLSKPLAKVAERCAAEGLPDLTSFVVSNRTGEPREGFVGDAEATRRKVFGVLSQPYWKLRQKGVKADVDAWRWGLRD